MQFRLFFFYVSVVGIGACTSPSTNEQAEKLALSAVDSAIQVVKTEPIIPPQNDVTTPQKPIVQLTKNDAKIAFAKGREQEGAENYAKAVLYYTQAIVADSTFADAYFQLGLVNGALDNHTQAIAAYQKAITYKYVAVATCYANLGYQQLAIKKYNQARKNFQQALASTEDAETYAGLAIACYYLNDLGDAQQAYQKAAQFDADFLKEDVTNTVSLKYLFTEADMIALTELSKKNKK